MQFMAFDDWIKKNIALFNYMRTQNAHRGVHTATTATTKDNILTHIYT